MTITFYRAEMNKWRKSPTCIIIYSWYISFPTIFFFLDKINVEKKEKIGLTYGWLEIDLWLEFDLGSRLVGGML